MPLPSPFASACARVSVNMDLPMDRLSELFNVNQSIVSQVNPHAHLFTGLNVGYGALGQILRFLKREIKSVSGRLWLRFHSFLSS